MCEQDSKSVYKEPNGFPYTMHVFRELQFVSCQPIFRHSVYKISDVYLSGARARFFLEIRDLGSPTNIICIICYKWWATLASLMPMVLPMAQLVKPNSFIKITVSEDKKKTFYNTQDHKIP